MPKLVSQVPLSRRGSSGMQKEEEGAGLLTCCLKVLAMKPQSFQICSMVLSRTILIPE